MKKFLLTIALALTVFSLFAQQANKPITYGLGVQFASPQGNFNYITGAGYGISAQAEYKTSKQFSVIGTIGFISYGSKVITTYVDGRFFGSITTAVTQLPVLVGSKFYFDKYLYASAQVGISFFNQYGGTAFTVMPSVGAKLGKRLDASFSYLIIPKTGYFFPGVNYSLSSLSPRLTYIF